MGRMLFGMLFALIPQCVGAEVLTILLGDIPALVESPKSQAQVLPGAPGPGADLRTAAQSIAHRAGFETQIKILPMARALSAASHNPYHCVLAGKAAEPPLQWVGPIVDGKVGLFARADATLALPDLDAARKLRIGVMRGAVAASILAKENFELDQVTKEEQNLAKLQMGRIDLWATLDVIARSVAKREGLPAPKLMYVIGNRAAYFGCHAGIPEARIQALAEAIKAFRAEQSGLTP